MWFGKCRPKRLRGRVRPPTSEQRKDFSPMCSFRIVSRTCLLKGSFLQVPFGNYRDSCKAADRTSLSEYKAFGIKSTVQNITILGVTMKNGGFEIGDGDLISCEKDRQGLMKDII